jgi:ABC-type glycerol-3-phosphate transport system permease component
MGIVIVFAIFALWPLLWVIKSSFEPTNIMYSTPPVLFPPLDSLTLDNYRALFGQGARFPQYIFNSVLITAAAITVSLSLGATAAYGLARLHVPFPRLTLALLTLLLGLPYGVFIIPIFQMWFALNMINTYPALILTYIGLNMPFAILILYAGFLRFSREIEESARIDGATHFQVYTKIALPAVGADLMVAGLLVFTNVWSDILIVQVLTNTDAMRTLAFGILIVREQEQSFTYAILTPMIVLGVVPIAILFGIFRNSYKRGVLEGSVQ